MSVAFQAAWMLLKNAPMSEKEFYRLEDDDEGMGGPSMPPMSRTLGGTPPANIGRAGNTDEMPIDDEPFNPFQLAAFADGAGRRAAMKPPMDDEPSMIEESHPEAHNIASTNIRETPRKTKRGQIDEPRATPRMQGRAARSPSPFIGGQ